MRYSTAVSPTRGRGLSLRFLVSPLFHSVFGCFASCGRALGTCCERREQPRRRPPRDSVVESVYHLRQAERCPCPLVPTSCRSPRTLCIARRFIRASPR